MKWILKVKLNLKKIFNFINKNYKNEIVEEMWSIVESENISENVVSLIPFVKKTVLWPLTGNTHNCEYAKDPR